MTLFSRFKVIPRDSVSQVFSRDASYDSPLTRAAAYAPTESRNVSYDSPMTFQPKVILRDSVSQVLSSYASNDFSMTFVLGHFQIKYF
jgi:hypothetical protein